jgi:TonB family protein
MTSSSRRALPWLLSIGSHLVVLVAVGLILAPQAGVVPVRSVDISLVGAPGSGRGAPRAGGSSPLAVATSTRAAVRAVSTSPPPPDTVALQGSRTMPPAESLPAPTASEVLADVASVTPEASGSPTGTLVGWEGIQRKLIRKRNPEFPTVLSANGQEIEGEARIAVAPSGIVTRVEITRSSGYIEIDASVEAALRDYLFSRVEGRSDTVGTVRFRFRLEKQD